MKMLGILLALILVFACAFSLVIIAQAQDASTGITDATFSDVIMNVGSDATERNLTWYSNYDTTGWVQYAKAEDMDGDAFPQEYKSAKARVAKASEKGSHVYKTTMRGLEANTEYAYRMVVGDTTSEVKFFKVKSFSDEFYFAFVTDPQVGSSGAKAQWIDTLAKIDTHFGEASFIVSGGDQIATPTAESDYDNFIVDGLSTVAIATTNGPAHDNTALYRDHYNLPNDSSTYGVSASASDYYYTYNSILFVHINVENENVEEHIEFLDRALENNPNALWQIVVIHHSYFSGSSASTNSNIVNMGKALAGAMNERGVDAVLSGHDHFYARSNLMVDYYTESTDTIVNNTVENPLGTLYICGSSSSGSGFDAPINTNNAAYQNATNRKSIVNVSVTKTSLTFDAYFVDGTAPELFDTFTIIRTDSKEPVNIPKYSVTYVTDTDVEHSADLSAYGTVSFAEGQLPDAPWLVLPSGSFEDGELYDWSWVYKNADGSITTSFTAGNKYYAYLTYETSKVSDEIFISRSQNPSNGIYTWADAWNLAVSFPDIAFKFILTENMTMTSEDALNMVSKTNVTVDLAGYTLNTQSIDYLVRYYIGATDSSFAVISSKPGAKIQSKELVRISSNHLSTITVSYGSEVSESITAELKYLVYAEGNFKRGSTLNLSVTKGMYTLSEGLIFVANAADDLSAANHYKVNIKDASITLGNSPVRFSSARKASASSYINATNSDFIMASGTASIVEKDAWYGSFVFYNCNLNGITFADSAITNIAGATFGAGTVFFNSDATFNSEKTAFASAKLSVSEGCSLYKSGSTVEVTEGERDPDNVLRIGNVANHEQSVYTFQEAWEIARANSGTAYVFKLNENINITSGIIKNQVKTDVTIDLNGYTFTCKNKYYLVSYENGSTGSSLALISSREGGKLIVDCFVCIGSGAKSVVNVSCGSDDGYPITVDSVHATYGYLAYMAGNFKGGSTLNLSVKNGTYNLYHGLLFVNNYGTNANNVYKLDVSNSVVSMGNACIGFSGSFRAASGSYINAVNSTFKATEGTEPILASAQWDGSLEFDNCRFEGIVFEQSTLASVSGAVFKEGCTFVNSDSSFKSDKTAFASDKLSVADGCVLEVDNGAVAVKKEVHTHTEGIIPGKAPTCTETGLTEGKYCTVCNDIITPQVEIPALGHNYNAVVTAPTCTTEGYTTYTCTVCGDTYVADNVAAAGHVDGAPVTENSVDATCTVAGGYDIVTYCTECNAETSRTHTNIDALGHTNETVSGKTPTCTETGLTNGIKCTVCGETLTEQEEIAALGHTEERIVGKAPTCTETGLTDGVKCTVCGETLTEQEEIAAIGHTSGASVQENIVAPDCINTGSLDEVVYCTVCDAELTRTTLTIEARGHNGGVATCLDPKKCDDCGEFYGEALEHIFTDYVADGNGSCTEDGTKTASCDNGCGTLDTIPNTGFAQGHSWKDATTESPKTCEVCGATEGEKLPEPDTEPTPEPDTEVTPDADDTPENNHDACVAKNAFEEFINMIINFIRSILGLPEICYCGEEY